MTAKSVLKRPQGLRPRARAPLPPLLATPLTKRKVFRLSEKLRFIHFAQRTSVKSNKS